MKQDLWTWETAYKKLFFLRFFLELIALALAIALAYITFQVQPNAVENNSYVPVINSSSPSTSNTKDWQTYSNTKYGFAFSFPRSVGSIIEHPEIGCYDELSACENLRFNSIQQSLFGYVYTKNFHNDRGGFWGDWALALNDHTPFEACTKNNMSVCTVVTNTEGIQISRGLVDEKNDCGETQCDYHDQVFYFIKPTNNRSIGIILMMTRDADGSFTSSDAIVKTFNFTN